MRVLSIKTANQTCGIALESIHLNFWHFI